MRSKKVEIIWRYVVISFFITLFAIAIVYRMVNTTIIRADEWNAKADSILNRVLFVKPTRGDILACDGTKLATNLTAYDISIDYKTLARHSRTFAAAVDSLCDSMAFYYPQRNKDEWKKYLTDPLAADAKNLKTYHLILKNANYIDYQRILKFPFFRNFKKKYSHGLCASPKEIRVLPYGKMAVLSIGKCNYQREPKFEGAVKNNDFVDVLHGYSGLEYALDSLLYGQNGTAHYEQFTRSMHGWVDKPAVDGLTLLTTIDINMQDIVENELLAMLEECDADWGTCLLMEVKTGDIKAISNFERDEETGKYIEARNYAVMPVEPGSVMKTVSMAIALEDGYAFPLDRELVIEQGEKGYRYAGGLGIRDTHSPPLLEVGRILEYSSNIGMTKLMVPHFENNINGFTERVRKTGLLDKFGTFIHGERPPYFPTLDPKDGGRVSLARMTYGYSTMISPLYTCAFYNAVANYGKFVRPRIVKQFISADGSVRENPVSYVRDSIGSVHNMKLLQHMLHQVVWGDKGTAKTARNDYVEIAGKTGTAKIARERKKGENPDSTAAKSAPSDKNASGYIDGQVRLAFCGFFPYEKPKYTCIVLISNPSIAKYRYPSLTSAKVLKNVALKMYARGMLDNHSDINDEKNPGSQPLLYAASDTRMKQARMYTGSSASHFVMPKDTKPGEVPDVTGMGMRDAVARIENAGYTIKFNGNGFAISQNPAPGTPLPAGGTVEVTFTTNIAKK